MENVVECIDLTHYYGKRLIYEKMNFEIKAGRVFGLLGKNGTGKTTTINIMNGYLKPQSGKCLLFGEDSQNLSPKTKARIGFLMEGHIQYNFMNIEQIERFYSAFYPNWKKEAYYELMKKLEVLPSQKLSTMSCGQRSQVALGLILAQDPDLMILDDYSMGLDAGYRRLFLDYLNEYVKSEKKTIFITSHIIQDLEDFVEDIVVLDYRGVLLKDNVNNFKNTFSQYKFDLNKNNIDKLQKNDIIKNFEVFRDHVTVYSFHSQDDVKNYINSLNLETKNFRRIEMTLEDAFIGLTGKY